MKVRTPYNYDAELASFASGIDCPPEEDQAQQQFAESADINEVVRRFGITGDIPVARALAEYGDFSEVVDFQTAMEQLQRGQEAFMDLPATVRERFNNDPGEMWEWLQSDEQENLDEAIRLGLIPEPPPIASAGPGGADPGSDPGPVPDEA